MPRKYMRHISLQIVLALPRVARVGKQQWTINRAMKRKEDSSNVFIGSLFRVGGTSKKPPSAYPRPLPQNPGPGVQFCRAPKAKARARQGVLHIDLDDGQAH